MYCTYESVFCVGQLILTALSIDASCDTSACRSCSKPNVLSPEVTSPTLIPSPHRERHSTYTTYTVPVHRRWIIIPSKPSSSPSLTHSPFFSIHIWITLRPSYAIPLRLTAVSQVAHPGVRNKMPSKKEKPIFRNLTIATAGDLGGQWTETNIARWVGLREGNFTHQMDNSVTHLLCTTEMFKERGPRVNAALKRTAAKSSSASKCHIVTIDWLEDSIFKNRRLAEGPFSLLGLLKQERARHRAAIKVRKGVELGNKFVNTNLYHIYQDATYFRYEVTLARDDTARYVLFPHLYWFAAKFYKRKGDTNPHFYRPSDCPGLFGKEFAEFKGFFYKKSGVEWDQRLVKWHWQGQRRGRWGVMDGKTNFGYTPPTGGKPVGWVPARYIPSDLPPTPPPVSAVVVMTPTKQLQLIQGKKKPEDDGQHQDLDTTMIKDATTGTSTATTGNSDTDGRHHHQHDPSPVEESRAKNVDDDDTGSYDGDSDSGVRQGEPEEEKKKKKKPENNKLEASPQDLDTADNTAVTGNHDDGDDDDREHNHNRMEESRTNVDDDDDDDDSGFDDEEVIFMEVVRPRYRRHTPPLPLPPPPQGMSMSMSMSAQTQAEPEQHNQGDDGHGHVQDPKNMNITKHDGGGGGVGRQL
ncbi:hypothetical protein QBC46DRAFT_441987 [Diplogelasinospora grovesii]|uniref:BRCT domain-containing protein n=1 Tax=Diplogelasinospora grovesii TaxID=303347 RepID=A0AAN6S8E2_9PEZI|nr:hypothetical protein QBC46DRAFT_441987 [Diplogelasinospora grovesii]